MFRFQCDLSLVVSPDNIGSPLKRFQCDLSLVSPDNTSSLLNRGHERRGEKSGNTGLFQASLKSGTPRHQDSVMPGLDEEPQSPLSALGGPDTNRYICTELVCDWSKVERPPIHIISSAVRIGPRTYTYVKRHYPVIGQKLSRPATHTNSSDRSLNSRQTSKERLRTWKTLTYVPKARQADPSVDENEQPAVHTNIGQRPLISPHVST